MSLRQRSPPKDPEVGRTPNTTGKTPVVASPAAAAAPAAAASGFAGFVSRNKKLLIAAGVVGAVVIIAASVQGSKNAAARASSANKLSDSASDPSGTPNWGSNGGSDATPAPTPSIYDTPDPTAIPVDSEEPSTLPPTPEIRPLPTPVCNYTHNVGDAAYFNALFFDRFWSNGSSCEGRLGVGNHCWLNLFSVGNGMFTPVGGCPTADYPSFGGGNYALIVAGGLTLNGTTVDNGGIAYGYQEEDVNLTYWNAGSGCQVSPGANLVQFGELETSVRGASAAISSLTSNLSVTSQPDANTLQFILNGSIMTEYFVVQESQLTGVSVFELVGTPKKFRGATATIIFNVVIDPSNTDGKLLINNWSTQGFDATIAKNIIWNFSGYQTLSFQQGAWFGTIIAPDAEFDTCIGDFYGGVFGKSWNTKQKNIQYKFHEARFSGLMFSDCSFT
eukprot:TRINITY_DN488_c0_g1_i1.p1 TRINITY_DN488_c0_g1~~TRINITY_DN488_c0_g1_i1.p1  ORF type:complete len:446 (+),score=128.87 TRINITY_DN488_c0_g1_i1:158-1495(+)